jgi:hypothetical protein
LSKAAKIVQNPLEPEEAVRCLAAAISLHTRKSVSGVDLAGRKACRSGTSQIRGTFHQIDSDTTLSLNQDPQSTDLLR